MLRKSWIGIGLGALWVAGCSGTLNPEDHGYGSGNLETAGTGSSGSGGAASMSTATGGVSATQSTTGKVAAAASTAYTNKCDQRAVDDSLGVFVLGSSGADTNSCGSRTSPCKTIAFAMARANGIKPTVYIGDGTYRETVPLIKGMRLEGGWAVNGSTWTYDCTAGATTIANTGDSIVRADELGGAASLAFVTVDNQTVAAPSQSLYGIFARGSTTTLTLEEVRVFVAKAGDGSNGAAGAYGAHGSVINLAGCDPSNGQPGAATAMEGSDATPGYFDHNGYNPGQGADGINGQPGNNGTRPVIEPTCVRKCSKCVGATSNACTTLPDSCGIAGKGGCGGGAGMGGTGTDGGPGGDGSGGFSYAIYRNLADHVTMVGTTELYGQPGGVEIEADPGGAGAIGGP